MDFDNQMWQVHSSQASQNLLAQICALDNVLDSFVSFAIALNFAYIKNNSIKEFPYASFVPNIIRFRCFGTTAIVLTLDGNELTRCNEEDGVPSPPPPPPDPVTKVPPGTPVEVSEPYDGPDDDGDTVPAPIDEPSEPPGPFPVGTCPEQYEVTVSLSGSAFEPEGIFTQTFQVTAPVTDVVIRPNAGTPENRDVYILHSNDTCDGTAETNVVFNDFPGVAIEDIQVEPL